MSPSSLHPPNHERDLLVKGGILSHRSLELVQRSQFVLARSRRSITDSGRRMDRSITRSRG